MQFNGKQYKTIKNSNGKLITVALPAGKYASKVEFYAVTNDDSSKGTLKEFDGVSCKDSVNSLKDYTNPTYIVKELAEPVNKFTFLFGGKQVCFMAVVTYANNANPNCADPQIAFGDWNEAENGFSVTLTTNEAGVSLSYSVDGADYVAYNDVFYVGSKAVVSAKASKEGYNDAIVTATAPLHSQDRQLEENSFAFVKGDAVSEGMRFIAPNIALQLHDQSWANEAVANTDPEAPEDFGYTAYVAGMTNPSPKDGSIPTSGCFYTFESNTGGTLKVAVKINAGKNLYVATAEQKLTVKVKGQDVAPGGTLSDVTYGMIEFAVEKNKTYYVWCTGSKIALFGFVFEAEEEAAVENTMMTSKAVKVIRNGQVVILRNGVEYNVLGAQF